MNFSLFRLFSGEWNVRSREEIGEAINKCPRKLRQKTVLNKSKDIKIWRVTGTCSKHETVFIHTAP